jgi:MFS family permease
MTNSADTAGAASFGRDARIIGLIGAGHFFSHFYLLVLPPLFVFLVPAFDLTYTEAAALISVMAFTSAAIQAPVGALVDRIGAYRPLVIGVLVQSAAMLAMGFAGSYIMLMLLAAIAGLGNSVYHPADYAIMSARLNPERMGRAFSIHTFSGHVGWAVAPSAIALLAASGGWRMALMISGACGLAVGFAMLLNRGLLDYGTGGDEGRNNADGPSALSLILSRPILFCFLFFVVIAMAGVGFLSFFIAAAEQHLGLTVETASVALTAYFTASAAGILAGGQIADRTTKHSVVAFIGFATTAALLITIAQFRPDGVLLFVMMIAAGFANGIVPPSRDMIVRAATPAGSTGKVFGFVSVGLDVGSVLTPILFGWIMDGGRPELVFVATAILFLLGGATVIFGRPKQAA